MQNVNFIEHGPVINSLSLTFAQTCQNGDKTATEVNAEEVNDETQDAPACSVFPEVATIEKYMWSHQQLDGK